MEPPSEPTLEASLVGARLFPEQFRGRVPSFSSQLRVCLRSATCVLWGGLISAVYLVSVKAGGGSFGQVSSHR